VLSTVTNFIILYKEPEREREREREGEGGGRKGEREGERERERERERTGVDEERIQYLSKKFIYYLKRRNVIEEFQISKYKISIK